jgi:hypothetical protein
VVFNKQVKSITVFRYLLAKVAFDPEGLSLDGYLALMDLYMKLVEHKDPNFQNKYGGWLITIQPFLVKLSGAQVFPVVILDKKNQEELGSHLQPFLPSPRAYFGMKENVNMRNCYRLVVNNPLKPLKKLPPKRYIGVGYKDHGALKDRARDGSPDWREVAMVNYASELQLEESLFPGLEKVLHETNQSYLKKK